jgi:hypothetical protein
MLRLIPVLALPATLIPATLIGATLALATLVLPLSALTCPLTLGDGVEVAYDDLSIARLTPTGAPGVLREWVIFSEDGEGYEVLAWYGLYTLRTANFDARGEVLDTVETTFFAQTPPPPEPGQRIDDLLAEVEKQGQRFQRRHQLIAGDIQPLVIGDCLYSAFEAELRVFDPDGAIRAIFSVIPSLGVAILTGSDDLEGAWTYAPQSIAALPPGAPPVAPALLD